jgi:hypothetical protein
MRKSTKFIAAAGALATLAVPTAAMAQGGGNVPCTDGSNQKINANVTVAAGQTCRFDGTINGNLTVNGIMLMQGGEVAGNVNVNPGGMFQGYNHGVTIDKNLTITNPAPNYASPIGGNNGFYGNEQGTTNVVKGDVNFTLNSGVYAPYTWAQLDFNGGTTVGGNINYSISSDVQNRPAPVIGQGGLISAKAVIVTQAL